MVLNFMIWKIFSCRPGRFCIKKGLPWFTMHNKQVITKKTGLKRIIKIKEKTLSKIGFITNGYLFFMG